MNNNDIRTPVTGPIPGSAYFLEPSLYAAVPSGDATWHVFHNCHLTSGAAGHTVLETTPGKLAVQSMRRLGLDPDPWQLKLLESEHPRLLLNCCRQAGKSTTAAVLALANALWTPSAQVALLSPDLGLFRRVAGWHHKLGDPLLLRLTDEELVLINGSRIVSLPCRGETIRGYSNVNLLIIDEAALVPDDFFKSVLPLLSPAGRLLCLSTPHGRRGFFYQEWVNGSDDWQRVEVPALLSPRISKQFLDEKRRQMNESLYRQEYCCSFESSEDSDFDRCTIPELAPQGRAERIMLRLDAAGIPRAIAQRTPEQRVLGAAILREELSRP